MWNENKSIYFVLILYDLIKNIIWIFEILLIIKYINFIYKEKNMK